MSRRPTSAQQAAFTLVEMMFTMIVMSILAALAITAYSQYQEKLRISRAEQYIADMSINLARFHAANLAYPPDLTVFGANQPELDPWGHPYVYKAIDIKPAPNKGQIRRDKNMNPLNSDFDLYSMGPDGLTATNLTATKARDDIVRAGNGSFIGKAEDF